MEGLIFLDANLYRKSMSLNLNNYTHIKDSLNQISERTLSVSKSWEGIARDEFINTMNENLLNLNESVEALFGLIKSINMLGLKLKRTQEEVLSVTGGAS